MAAEFAETGVQHGEEAAVAESGFESRGALVGVVKDRSVHAEKAHFVVRIDAEADVRTVTGEAPGMEIEEMQRWMIGLHRIGRRGDARAPVLEWAVVGDSVTTRRVERRPGGRDR